MPTAPSTPTAAPPAPTTTSTAPPAKTASATSPPLAKAAAPTPPPERTEALADAFADLDALDRAEQKPYEKPETKSSKTSSKSSAGESQQSPTSPDTKDAESTATDAEKSSETPETPQKPPEQPPGAKEPQSRAQLRDAYDSIKKRVRNELEPKIKQLEARVQEYESNAPAVPKEVAEKLTALEKRNGELEQHMRFVDYSKSKEYQEQFWNPYVKQWQTSLRELKGLQLKLGDKDEVTGEPKYREISEQDIQYLANLDPAARRQQVKQLFPDDAQEVMRHINEISRLFDASQDALKNARSNAENYSRQQQLQQQQWQQQHSALWKNANQTLAQKYPERFAPTEGDTEGNQWLDRGKALADLVFSPQDVTPEQIEMLPKVFKDLIQADKPLSERDKTFLYSIVRNKAMNHDRLEFRLHTAKARIAELETALKEYESSTPDNVPAGAKTTKSTKGFMVEANDELDAIDRKHSALGV